MKKILAHPFVKGSAIMLSGTMVANILAYVYHLVMGRMLGPVGYGELAALISIFYVLNAPSSVVQNILVKFFSGLKAKHDYGQAKRLFLRITRLLIIIQIALFVLLLPFVTMVGEFLHIADNINLIWLYLMFAMFLFTVINISVLQAFQQFFAITVINAIGGVLRLALGAIGAIFGVGWALFGNVVAAIVGYLATFIPLKTLLAEKEKIITISPISALYYSVPACIAVICITALYSQDVVLVKHFFSPEDAGIYSSLSVLGKIIFFASSALGAVAFPILAEYREVGKPYGKIVAMALGTVAIISFSITALYFLFPQFVVSMLFGQGFVQAGTYLGTFGLFISFFTLSYLLTTMYLAIGKTNIWFIVAASAIAQIALISLYHDSLADVIRNNAYLAGGLFVALLLYYPYATRR